MTETAILKTENASPAGDNSRKGIHQAESPIITGDAKYSSPQKLWNVKTARHPAEISQEDIDRTQKLKPVLRDIVQEQKNNQLDRILMTHNESDFIYATFDGFDERTGEFWHLKTPRVNTHATISYYRQMVGRYKTELLHQQMVAESLHGERVKGFFASYVTDEAICEHYAIDDAREAEIPNLIILPFEFDRDRLPKLLTLENTFWDYVETDQKPRGFPKLSQNILGSNWRWE